jgi:hypothetical protein
MDFCQVFPGMMESFQHAFDKEGEWYGTYITPMSRSKDVVFDHAAYMISEQEFRRLAATPMGQRALYNGPNAVPLSALIKTIPTGSKGTILGIRDDGSAECKTMLDERMRDVLLFDPNPDACAILYAVIEAMALDAWAKDVRQVCANSSPYITKGFAGGAEVPVKLSKVYRREIAEQLSDGLLQGIRSKYGLKKKQALAYPLLDEQRSLGRMHFYTPIGDVVAAHINYTITQVVHMRAAYDIDGIPWWKMQNAWSDQLRSKDSWTDNPTLGWEFTGPMTLEHKITIPWTPKAKPAKSITTTQAPNVDKRPVQAQTPIPIPPNQVITSSMTPATAA